MKEKKTTLTQKDFEDMMDMVAKGNPQEPVYIPISYEDVSFITNDEFFSLPWYDQRPPIIKEFLQKFPPTQYYRLKSSGHQCYILSVEEPESGLAEDVTCTIQKTGRGSIFPMANNYGVFGIKADDLEPWTENLNQQTP